MPQPSKELYTVAIVGATGAVGLEMGVLLAERRFPFGEVKLLASQRSAGKKLTIAGNDLTVMPVSPQAFEGVDFALFSAGASISRQIAHSATEQGAIVIDNTSAFRMDADTPLVVPEVNPEDLRGHGGIIANPNCSTIQMVLALAPLQREWGLSQVIVSTYQSASGAGQRAMQELLDGSRDVLADGTPGHEMFPHPLAFNCVPQIGDFDPDGFSVEETKMIEETRKILHAPELKIAATCVRVPVLRAHSESVAVRLQTPVAVERVRSLLDRSPGLRLIDEPNELRYPMPVDAAGKDDTFVGRIRVDRDDPHWLHLWIVSDNLRKGAATNAVQIAEHLCRKA